MHSLGSLKKSQAFKPDDNSLPNINLYIILLVSPNGGIACCAEFYKCFLKAESCLRKTKQDLLCLGVLTVASYTQYFDHRETHIFPLVMLMRMNDLSTKIRGSCNAGGILGIKDWVVGEETLAWLCLLNSLFCIYIPLMFLHRPASVHCTPSPLFPQPSLCLFFLVFVSIYLFFR